MGFATCKPTETGTGPNTDTISIHAEDREGIDDRIDVFDAAMPGLLVHVTGFVAAGQQLWIVDTTIAGSEVLAFALPATVIRSLAPMTSARKEGPAGADRDGG